MRGQVRAARFWTDSGFSPGKDIVLPFVERKVGDLTIRIDRTLCVGFGDCIEVAPDALEFDDEGIAKFKEAVDGVERDRLIQACDICPVDAISVFDVNGNQLV